jgi:hypothetical protein
VLFIAAAEVFAQHPVRRFISSTSPVLKELRSHNIVVPKIRSIHKNYPTKTFGAKQKKGFVSEKTTITGNKGRISFDINLGEAFISPSKKTIGGALGKQFSDISWSNLLVDKLPAGITMTSVGGSGSPEIPALTLMIAIPEGATGIVPFDKSVTSKSFSKTFLPPGIEKEGGRVFAEKNYYRNSSFSPKLSDPAKIRTMNIISFTIPLAEFSPRTGELQVKKKLSCGITFTTASQVGANTKKPTDLVFEGMYENIVANPSDIFSFRAGFHSHASSNKITTQSFATPTFDFSVINWIDPGASYVKLYATRTGLYRVTQQMISQKLDISAWKTSEVRMFNKGKEIPIWIDSTTDGRINAIEYFGERLPGYPKQYYNWDSDSNAYWVTNSKKFQTPPLRFQDKTVTGNPSVTATDGSVTLHHEQDDFYFGGVGDDIESLHRNEWVPGEAFVWQFLPSTHNNNNVTSLIDTFYLPSIPSDQSAAATIQVYLWGISHPQDTSHVTHSAAILINGADVSHVGFLDIKDTLHSFTIPVNKLHVGANTFEIDYLTGINSPDKWYLDYYSVSLTSPLSPSLDTAIAKGQWDFSLSVSQPENISLQSSTQPHVFNLTDGTRLISNGADFKENLLGTNRYVAATPSSFLSPDRILNASGIFASILDSTQGADYILITHPLFLQSALKLEARRKLLGLRTKVVTTDEVFDAFNFGSDEPWAIRRYLQYAFEFYHGTPPAFVTLFGEGTWDPKNTLNNPLEEQAGKTIHPTFVPTYGVPVSDYIYTAVEGTSPADTQTFRMVIARIPAESQDDAENYVAKLVDYETSAPAPWNKHFLFIAGGDPGGQSARIVDDTHAFLGDSLSFLGKGNNDWGGLGNPHLSITPTIVARTNFKDNIDISHVSEIQTAFKNGQSLAYFAGHGAPNITDVQLPDVGSLHNKGAYPVLITVSCRTGAFAEPNIISMNESFIRVPDAGAILAFGTTGFGDLLFDELMSKDIFLAMRGDASYANEPGPLPHELNMPTILTMAKFTESVIAHSGSGSAPHNALYEYSILGDAATGFNFRPEPEFNITPQDILLEGKDSLPRTVFSLADSEITVKYTVHNFGYGIDKPVHIKITNNEPGSRQIVFIDSVESLENIASSGVVISLDSFAIGTNTLDILVDYDDQFPTGDRGHNEAQVTFLVNGNSGTPFYPPEGSKYFCDITSDSVHVMVLLPHAAPGVSTTLDIQFDSTVAFTSPKDFPGLKGSGLFFQRSFPRSALPNPASGVIWWRTSILLPNGKQSAFETQSFSVDAPKPPAARSEFSYSTGDQFRNTIISGLQVDQTDGSLYIPLKDTIQIDVEARALHDTNVVGVLPIGQILFSGKAVYPTAGFPSDVFDAVTVVELTPDSSSVERVFKFLPPPDSLSLQTALADSFAITISGIPVGRKVIVLTNFQPVIPNFTTSTQVTNALESLGSANGMDQLVYFGSYALIGQKGYSKGRAKEKFSGDHTAGVSLLDTFITLGTSGLAQTPTTAIASGYGSIKWKTKNVDANSTIKLTVFGIRKIGGRVDTVAKIDASSGSSFDLSVNPASFYNKMFVQMNFERSSSSTVSPRLNSLELEYDPAPEFSIDDSSLTVTPRSVFEGTPVTAAYQVQNVTCIDADNVPVQLVQNFHGISTIIATDTIKHFAGHTATAFSHTVPTTGLNGVVNLTATINPGGVMNEQLAFNNSSSTTFTVLRDTVKPKLELVFDSRHINSGDFVSSTVTIEIRLSTSNPIRLSDSASLKGILQPLFGNAGPTTFTGGSKTDSFAVNFKALSQGVLQATLDINPNHPLLPGRYYFQAFGNDASGNRTDSVSDEFVVSKTNGLDHVMNYPNPFKDNTWFTFILKAGSQADVKVVVYTVAGRKIRTLKLDPTKQHAGLNNIEWDGRDEMGNEVANGTYLYRVVLNGTNDDGSPSSDAITERAVKSK